MKLTTLRVNGSTVSARLNGSVESGTYTEIPGYKDLTALLADEKWFEVASTAAGREHDATSVELAPVVPNPSKILCVGLNYSEHILEMGRQLPAYPTLFAKFADTLTGPNDAVAAVVEDPDLDWEGELAIVIGKPAYRVREDQAEEYIAGYTAANDVSMRGWQARTQEWLQGKIWGRSTPVGPVMVTADEFDVNRATLQTVVNGQTMQKHSTEDLLFKPAFLVAYISTIIPLRPGDLILTGTPGGVGKGRNPEIYLKPGDVVEVNIDGIGSLKTAISEPLS